MKKFVVIACLAVGSALAAITSSQITREANHELRSIPDYGVFDVITYTVQGTDITLYGSVTRSLVKDEAEKAVKSIEGVTSVHNMIEVLPLSNSDDAIRMSAYRAIYGQPSLARYSLNAILPIHIIVKNGNVELAGFVASDFDKKLVESQANTVSGVHSVHNSLMISKN